MNLKEEIAELLLQNVGCDNDYPYYVSDDLPGDILKLFEKRIDSRIKKNWDEPPAAAAAAVYLDTDYYSGVELRHLLILELQELQKGLK